LIRLTLGGSIIMTISRLPFRLFLPLLSLSGLIAILLSASAQEKDIPGLVHKFTGHNDAIYSLEFTPDGKYIVTGSFDQTLKMWDTATGKEVRTFGGQQGHQKMVLCVALSPNGQMMVSGGLDNQLKVWDVPSSSPLKSLANNAEINDIALTTDSKKVATAGKDGLVKIYNVDDGKELFKLEGHAGEVKSVAFSANNAVVGSAGVDGTVRFWNATNGQPMSVIGGHAGAATAVANRWLRRRTPTRS
jgi:WD40 repeat protein